MEIKIKLKLKDGKEVEITEKEGQDLYNLLHKIYGDKEFIQRPIIIEKWIHDYPWYNPPYLVTCGTTSCDLTYSIGDTI